MTEGEAYQKILAYASLHGLNFSTRWNEIEGNTEVSLDDIFEGNKFYMKKGSLSTFVRVYLEVENDN